ncbi:MAG TPA: glycosyltransferase family 39 protein [Candidatus Binataceae bacterium]|nr:glycosyltransferase family 39 protein [Candidatus Binataceae bacterium]
MPELAAALKNLPQGHESHPKVASRKYPGLGPAVIVVVGLLLFFINLGHPMYTKGEPREGVTVIDLVNGQGFILPNQPLVEMPYKPPMMRWLAWLGVQAIDRGDHVDELTMRLPSALLGIGTMLLCYGYGAALFDPAVGLLAALMLGTSLQFIQGATNARVDMTLTFFLVLAMFEFLLMAEGRTRRWWLLYLAIAGAILSKGPVGLVLPLAVAIAWSALESRRFTWRRYHLWGGAIIVIALAGSWYLAAAIVGGRAFVMRQLVAENLFAFFYSPSLSDGHDHSVMWLFLSLLVGWLPWAAMLPWVIGDLRRQRRTARLSYLLVWIMGFTFFYSLAYQKRGIYLLAIYPALALLSAGFVLRTTRGVGSARGFSVLAVLFGTVFCGLALGAGLLLALCAWHPAAAGAMLNRTTIAVPGLATDVAAHCAQWPWLSGLLCTLALACGVAMFVRRAPLATSALAVVALTSLIVLSHLVFMPAISGRLTLRSFTNHAMALVGDHSVAYLDGLNYEIAFYSRRPIAVIGAPLAHWPDYVVVGARSYRLHHRADLAHYSVVLRSGPTELNGHGAMLLMARNPPRYNSSAR